MNCRFDMLFADLTCELQIGVAVKKLTSKTEAGLVGCLELLIHILPYLSDSTLMDILQVGSF